MNALERILAVTRTEFRVAVRNRWVLLATVTLTLFALALAFLGSAPAGSVKADALTLTAVSLSTLSVYLIPLIALLITYDGLAGEIERGTLALVLATRIHRFELLLGKFLGALAVLVIAIFVGYGIAGGAVIAADGWTVDGLVVWGRLIGTAVALGAVFLSLGLMLSGVSRQTGTAAALAVGCWLVLVVLYDLALLGAVMASGSGGFTQTIFPLAVAANPADAFRLFNLATIDSAVPVSGLDGLAATLPFPPAVALATLAGWLVLLLSGSVMLMKRIRP